ncbi:unnamed protein product, partial [Discosporangium mesarthrocarpum]
LIPSTTPLSLSVTDDANKVYQLPAEFFELSPEEPSLQEGTCSFKLVVREGAPLTGNRMKVRASYQQVEAESDVLTMCRSEISIIKEPPKCWYKDEGGKNNCIEIRAQVKDKASALPRVGVPLTLAILYEVGTAVYSQDILQVQADTRLVTDKTGCAVLKFRIKEVSQRHQGQKFVIKIAPDTKQSPTMNNVAPASTIPTMVLSKRKNRNRHQTAAATTTRGERPPPGGTGYPLGKDHQGQALPRDMSSSPPSTGSGNLIGGNHFQGAGIGMRPTQRLMDGRSPWSEEPAPPMTRDMTPMSRAMAPMTPHMRLDQWGSSALQPNRAPQPPPHSHPPQHANRAHLQHPPAPPPPPGGLVPPPLQGPAPSLPKGATGPLREVFKWTEAVLHLLQVELQWEHVGFEIDSSGVVDYSRPMWRCPICRRCKDMLRPTQQHDEECRLDGLLREYSDRIKAHFQSIKDQLVKDKMGPGGSSNSGRDSNFKGTNNISSLLRADTLEREWTGTLGSSETFANPVAPTQSSHRGGIFGGEGAFRVPSLPGLSSSGLGLGFDRDGRVLSLGLSSGSLGALLAPG